MATDAVVGARDVLAALAEVRRAGSRRAWSALEAAEPDLAEFALEEVTAIHHRLLATAATPRQVRRLTRRVQRLALVLATALRRARLRLWRDAGDGLPVRPEEEPARTGSRDLGSDERRMTMADAPDRPGEGDVVFRYTRRHAVADGVLVDLTAWAWETGFVVPVACTAAVWHLHVVPDPTLEPQGQSARGRGHDLLWMLYHAIRGRPPDRGGGRLAFDVVLLRPPGSHETVRLNAVIGPGDDAEPVLTVMLPHED